MIPFAVDSLPSGAALAVDCDDLRERAFGGKLPAGLIDGFIVVRSTERLDAETVYSTATLNAEGSAEDHSSIDVRRVQARKVNSTRPPRARPNLVVLAIDEIDVDCPAGAGSCVTKARARLANVSANPAGTFAARAILDPKQSVEVNQSFPGGLMPGNETDFLIVTPPGDNCFNPDCTICVTVDPDDLVAKSDETDNQLCVTTQG